MAGGRGGTVAVLDVDGTLIDSNYQHALSWYRALRERGRTVALWELHRHIGMGGDQLVAALAGRRASRTGRATASGRPRPPSTPT